MTRIGVTGHRYLAGVDRIAAGIAEALQRIGADYPAEKLEVVSPLAEGADRLVVQQVLALPGSRLIVVLPLSRDDYLNDFESSESRDEFLRLLARADQVVELQPAESRVASYEAAGWYVLDHCDVLVAVWDGQGAQGQGGTGGIVTEARRRGLPIAWVHSGNRLPGTREPTSLGDEQGKVTFERFPVREGSERTWQSG